MKVVCLTNNRIYQSFASAVKQNYGFSLFS